MNEIFIIYGQIFARKHAALSQGCLSRCVRLPGLLLLAFVAPIAPLDLFAQSYPASPIRLVVGFSAGGGIDVPARVVAQKLSESLGQPVLVENAPGAAGFIAMQKVATSPANGYTLLITSSNDAVLPALRPNLSIDLQRDFAPVSLVAIAPNIVVINPAVPATSLVEFIAYAKSQPGKLSYASGGNGSSAHMSMELFKSMAGVDIQHVPYKGSTPALTDLIGGQVAIFIGNMPPAVPHVKAGKLRALAVTTKARSALMPELPTMTEAGLPGYETVAWFGVLAPAGTPPDIVNRLSMEIGKIVRSPEMRDRLVAMGAEPVGGTPEEFKTVIDRDIAKWKALAQKVGIKID